MAEAATNMRVKEREDPDWCRFCGRPTWSLRRCCVRCKRAGKTGEGIWPSRYAPGAAASRGWSFVAFFTGHAVTTTAVFILLAFAAGIGLPPFVLPQIVVISMLFALMDGIGYAVACAMTKRTSYRFRVRYYALSLAIGVLCALAGCGAVSLLARTLNPPSLPVCVLILIALAASLSQLILAIGFATGFLAGVSPPADKALCRFCGFDLTGNTQLTCPLCGEQRQSY